MKRYKKLIVFFIFASLGVVVNGQLLKPVDAQSTVKFSIKNFGINTGGRFTGLKGTIHYDPAKPLESGFDVSVDARTIDTDLSARDKHLRKEEYFDVDKFPEIHFVSTAIKQTSAGWIVSGKLSIKGITKEISFPFTTAVKNGAYLFTGEFKINRRDFKVGGSSTFLSDNLKVSLSVFATKT
jgi:polyisoprenoid-binding protein YceI